MQPTGRLNHMAQLSWLQCKCCILELLLHISSSKVSQISHFAGRAAVRLGNGEVGEGGLPGADLLLVGEDNGGGFLLSAVNFGL